MKLGNKKYIAAVSGGPDSMALLHKYQKHIIGVCHVNYHKRVDSDYDTKIVKTYCVKHNIPLAIYDVKASEYKKSQIHNFQNLARVIRYSFFVNCSKKFKCNNLLIAHNLNDFLETAIMQQNRNSLNFYYGIRPRNKYLTLNIFRPLIKSFKGDLELHCKKHNVSYAIDSSNAADIYERNRIRKQLSKLSRKQLLKLYEQFVKQNKSRAILERHVNKWLNDWKKSCYQVKCFKQINPKFQDGVIYLYLKKNNIINVNYNKIKLVRDFIVSNRSNNCLRLEQNIGLLKKDKKIKIVKHK